MSKELEFIDGDEQDNDKDDDSLSEINADDLDIEMVESEEIESEVVPEKKTEEKADDENDFSIDIPDFEYEPEKTLKPVAVQEGEEVPVAKVSNEPDYKKAFARSKLELAEIKIDGLLAQIDEAVESGDNRAKYKLEKQLAALEEEKRICEEVIASPDVVPVVREKKEAVVQEQPQLHPVVQSWVNQNKHWFGVKGHEAATAKAIEVYEKLIADGMSESHPNTFKKVNEILRGNKASGQPVDKKASTVLAVKQAATKTGKTTVQISRKEMIKFGFNPESKEHQIEFAKMIQRENARAN